jgi:transglutaminase-like putative cysteine protease
MSAAAQTIHVPGRFARARTDRDDMGEAARAVIRVASFGALSLYGVQRWGTLMRNPPTWRLLGLFALGIAVAGGVPLLRRYNRVLAAAVLIGLLLAAFPMAGLRWHWVVHARIAVSAGRIEDGLQALPNVLVPYLGTNHAVRLVIMLGAAVLLLDGAVVVALGGRGRSFGDGRRAASALPLLALAVVPSTLVRPQLPYVQGLILFALLAAFMWGERLRRQSISTVLTVATLAGVVGGLVAPRIDTHQPWVNYRSWAGTLIRVRVDRFDWNQTYGPLRWPRTGHQVLTVTARSGDYWKAQDLDQFNGREWVAGAPVTGLASLPGPTAAAQQRWSQQIRVSITGMSTDDVVGAGYSSVLSGVPGDDLREGADAGTWATLHPLGPGASYVVSSYSPHPTAAELRHVAAAGYPDTSTVQYRTLGIPQQNTASSVGQITFARFHTVWPGGRASRQAQLAVIDASPYAGAYALAQQLAKRARTAYQYVVAVKRYLSHGFSYDENPPDAAYPLESFLFKNKLGYCQQFSGAMALLLRMGGVPARVAAGFTSGVLQNKSHTWQVSDIDAHAWVEAWFPQYGWVRFDPTPATAPARGGAASDPIIKGSGFSGETPGGVRREIGAATTPVTTVHRNTGSSGPSPWLVVPILLVAALLGRLAWLLLAGAGSTDDLLSELRRAMARTGRPLAQDATLASLERRFADSPDAVAYVRALRLARYGVPGDPPSRAQRRALRHQLSFGLGAAGRLRALWALPPRPRQGVRAPRD